MGCCESIEAAPNADHVDHTHFEIFRCIGKGTWNAALHDVDRQRLTSFAQVDSAMSTPFRYAYPTRWCRASLTMGRCRRRPIQKASATTWP